ncbi:MAG: hypothetical protein WDM80_17675 [Limisphaerales bacterium]
MSFVWVVHESKLSVMLPWAFNTLVLMTISLLVTISNQDQLSLRVRSKIPQTGVKRIGAFIFFNGAAGGLVWVAIILLTTYFSTMAASSLMPGKSSGSGSFEDEFPFIFLPCSPMFRLCPDGAADPPEIPGKTTTENRRHPDGFAGGLVGDCSGHCLVLSEPAFHGKQWRGFNWAMSSMFCFHARRGWTQLPFDFCIGLAADNDCAQCALVCAPVQKFPSAATRCPPPIITETTVVSK